MSSKEGVRAKRGDSQRDGREWVRKKPLEPDSTTVPGNPWEKAPFVFNY